MHALKMNIVLLFLYLTIVQSFKNGSDVDENAETVFSSEERQDKVKTEEDYYYNEDNHSITQEEQDYFKIWSDETQTNINAYQKNSNFDSKNDNEKEMIQTKMEGNNRDYFKIWSEETQTIINMSDENDTINFEDSIKYTGNQEVLENLHRFLNIKPFVPPSNFIPPQFMTDLYHVVTDPQSGETIRDNPHDATEIWGILEDNPSTAGLFKFDLSGLTDQQLLEAELHVYRIGLDIPVSAHHPPYYLLRVYQVMPTSSNHLKNPDINQLLNVHYVSAFGTGWQVFKIKRAVDAWRNGAPNLGILITATTILNEPVDLRFTRKGFHGDKYQPTLILYNGKNNQQLIPTNRPNPMDIHKLAKRSMAEHHQECNRIPLYIDFEQLGLKHVVIAPEGFESYQCEGRCGFPLEKPQNNHAIFQSVMKFLGASTVEASCVPIEMKSLSILFLTENLYVKLVKFDDMIISKCGCR